MSSTPRYFISLISSRFIGREQIDIIGWILLFNLASTLSGLLVILILPTVLDVSRDRKSSFSPLVFRPLARFSTAMRLTARTNTTSLLDETEFNRTYAPEIGADRFSSFFFCSLPNFLYSFSRLILSVLFKAWVTRVRAREFGNQSRCEVVRKWVCMLETECTRDSPNDTRSVSQQSSRIV